MYEKHVIHTLIISDLWNTSLSYYSHTSVEQLTSTPTGPKYVPRCGKPIEKAIYVSIDGPHHEKNNILHMRKQMQISFAVTAKLIRTFVFA